MTIDLCLTFIVQPLVILASILLLIRIPPINCLYGYRTRKSSVNEDSWKFANKTAAITMISVASLSLLVGSLLLLLKYGFSISISFMWYAFISLFGIIVLPILITEILLSIRAKKMGKRNEK